MNDRCTRAEVLAGAIALGEATAAEREEYRRHIAGCARCLNEFGGERGIERVMATVGAARGGETWEPVLVRWRERGRNRSGFWGASVFVAGAGLALVIGMHSNARGPQHQPVHAVAVSAEREPIYHVSIEPRPRRTQKPVVIAAVPRVTPTPAQQRIMVVHSVITRRGDNVTQTTIATTEVADAPVPRVTVPPSNVPIWRRDEAMPHAYVSTPAPVFTGRAESIAVAAPPIIREVQPIGGDAAINPRPAPIAYAENAYGTTAFEVTVDERGVPVRCSITKSSGFSALDVSVCKAAMNAHYSPRLVNGKATLGVYRDAFTFRELSDGDDNPF